MQQLGEQSRLLVDLASIQSSSYNSIKRNDRSPVHSGSTASSGYNSPHATADIISRAPRRAHSRCANYCKCSCHTYQRIGSPTYLHNATGMLFVGYSGYPHEILQRCDTSFCQGPRGFQISVAYVFPLWFVCKAVIFGILCNSSNRICASLRVTRLVPPDADVFRLTDMNDVDGLKRLFSKGLATPSDAMCCDGSSCTLLEVMSLQHFHIYRQIADIMVLRRFLRFSGIRIY